MIYTADAGWIDGQIIGGTDYYLEVRKPTLFNKGSVPLWNGCLIVLKTLLKQFGERSNATLDAKI
jgi:hypothetical protein